MKKKKRKISLAGMKISKKDIMYAKKKAEDAFRVTKVKLVKAEEDIKKYVKKNPKKAAAIAAGIGAVVGAAIASALTKTREK